MFWMSHFRISQSTMAQFAWPNSHDALDMRVPFKQIDWIELERTVKQEFNVVHQQQIASGMLLCQFTQDRRGLQVALSLWNH